MDRFWQKVNKIPGGCWEWKGCRVRGYGQIRVSGRLVYTHRLSWELHNGPIPHGLIVCHRCDNPACVHPEHLFLGTHKDNGEDKARKQRASRLKGETNPQSKLSQAQVRQIVSLHRNGASCTDLAHTFGVDRTTVSKIINGINWKHINVTSTQ